MTVTISHENFPAFVRMLAAEIKRIDNIPNEVWISSSKAYVMYGGRALVDSMVNSGNIRFIRTDGKNLLKVEDLEREIGKMICSVSTKPKRRINKKISIY